MLEYGVSLSAKIEQYKHNNSTIYNVDNNYLLICLDRNIQEVTVEYLASKHPLNII